MSKILEPRQIAIAKSISFADAQKIVDDTPGEVRYWVYHHCQDAPPICSAEHNDRIPESLWSDDWERYECPECQEEVRLNELHFEAFKVVSDEDYQAIQRKPREEYLNDQP